MLTRAESDSIGTIAVPATIPPSLAAELHAGASLGAVAEEGNAVADDARVAARVPAPPLAAVHVELGDCLEAALATAHARTTVAARSSFATKANETTSTAPICAPMPISAERSTSLRCAAVRSPSSFCVASEK